MEPFLSTQLETMQLVTRKLAELQAEINSLTSSSNSSPQATTSGTGSSIVPWPKPLSVDTGDINENFQLFKSNWETYVKATGMDKWDVTREAQKVSILLSIVGDAAKLKYNNFGLNADDELNTQSVLDKIGEKLLAKQHPMYERWLFHTCNQLENETFSAYLVRLTKILDKCQFDKIEPDKIKKVMLRDRIAFGIKDQELKKKFLKENPDKLTLQEVINSCTVNEATEDRLKQMKVEEKVVNKVSSSDKSVS